MHFPCLAAWEADAASAFAAACIKVSLAHLAPLLSIDECNHSASFRYVMQLYIGLRMG